MKTQCAHFGKPGQPHSEESLAWLRQRILGKTVYCRLLQRDQYNRIIAHVSVKHRFLPWGSSLAVEMLREGMAGVYEQAGAQYGPGGKEEFLRIEAEAKAARRGMWKSGLSGETPAEYKRRYQEGKKAEKVEEEEQVPRKGLFSRLFGR
ncbi:putative endonuclease lcl3 [Paramarasmius palmivorus]|uniref:Endonuclease lcl3 n=1 Tax=Paramarasmius palmivorus TaxID=297713 RepID=A0AAW0C3J6_9AGAR